MENAGNILKFWLLPIFLMEIIKSKKLKQSKANISSKLHFAWKKSSSAFNCTNNIMNLTCLKHLKKTEKIVFRGNENHVFLASSSWWPNRNPTSFKIKQFFIIFLASWNEKRILRSKSCNGWVFGMIVRTKSYEKKRK